MNVVPVSLQPKNVARLLRPWETKVEAGGMKGILVRPAACALRYVWWISVPLGKLEGVSALLSFTIRTSTVREGWMKGQMGLSVCFWEG